jgi:hypothetical protein
MKTFKNLPEFVKINDNQTIYRDDFAKKMEEYGYSEGYSYDEFSIAMTWIGIVNNKIRSDGRTEREVWVSLLF